MKQSLRKFFDSLTKKELEKQIKFSEEFENYLLERVNPFCEEVFISMKEQGINPYKNIEQFVKIVEENFKQTLK